MNTIESTNKYTKSIKKSINNTLTNTEFKAGIKKTGKVSRFFSGFLPFLKAQLK